MVGEEELELMSKFDPHSIFSHGWTQSFDDDPIDTGLVGSQGWSKNSRKEDDWRNFPNSPGKWFKKEGNEYDGESELFDVLVTESINNHGVACRYYCVNYDLERDKLFKEDSDKVIQRSFPFMSYFKLQNEVDGFAFGMIEGLDQFVMFVSMRHFGEVSKFDQYGKPNIYESYIPQEGDKIRSDFNNYYYTITQVKKQTHQFHKRSHIWELTVKPMKDESLTVSAGISHDDINHEQEINDILNIGGVVDTEKETILYEKDQDGVIPDADNGW